MLMLTASAPENAFSGLSVHVTLQFESLNSGHFLINLELPLFH